MALPTIGTWYTYTGTSMYLLWAYRWHAGVCVCVCVYLTKALPGDKTNKLLTLHWGHLLALWAHVPHIMAWPHGSNRTSIGASHRKQGSRFALSVAVVSTVIKVKTKQSFNTQTYYTVTTSTGQAIFLWMVFGVGSTQDNEMGEVFISCHFSSYAVVSFPYPKLMCK